MNRLKETVTRAGAVVVRGKKTYDLNGNVETETDAGGVTRRHTYDALNRLRQTAIESGPALAPLGPLASYEYNLVGAKQAETDLIRNQRTDYVLDGLYRAKEQQLPESYQGQRLTVAHTFDKVGNVLTEKDKDGKITESEYDQLNRLVRVTKDLDGVAATTRVRYCNDPQDPAPTVGIEKCEEYDELRRRRALYVYDELHRVRTATERLEGPDGDPAIDEYVTETTYQDAEHQMTVKDPREGLTVVRLDGLNHVAETRVDDGGLGLATKTVYDGLGLKKRVSDSRGNTTIYQNDGLGRVTRVTDREQRTATPRVSRRRRSTGAGS
jgi:YD repeat-containing protein